VCLFVYVLIFAHCIGRLLGRKSYVAEYTADAKCLWIASNYQIVEIYLAIHTPVIPRSLNEPQLAIRSREYISQTKADERPIDSLFKVVSKEGALSGPQGISHKTPSAGLTHTRPALCNPVDIVGKLGHVSGNQESRESLSGCCASQMSTGSIANMHTDRARCKVRLSCCSCDYKLCYAVCLAGVWPGPAPRLNRGGMGNNHDRSRFPRAFVS
jgi:hypothetical protein